MFGTAILETVIGVVLLYTILSLVCTAINEFIAQIIQLRTKNLVKGIDNLINNDAIKKDFFKHPLIVSLGKKKKSGKIKESPYIPATLFSSALFDIVLKDNLPQKGKTSSQGFTIKEIQDTVSKLPDSDVKKAFLAIIATTGSSVDSFIKGIEKWFDDVMERVGAWYRRSVRWIILGIAMVLTGSMNIDTIQLSSAFLKSPTLRKVAVAMAEEYTADNQNIDENDESIKELMSRIDALSLPIGWGEPPTETGDWIIKILGLLITAFAISLGAPFWFDLLKRFMSLRESGNRPKRSDDPRSQPSTQM